MKKKATSLRQKLVRLWSRLRYRLSEVRLAQMMRESWRQPRKKESKAKSQQPRGEVERNIQLLYFDVFFAAIFMAVMAFNATFVLRLGASNQMIGWLSSIPSLFAMLMMIPAARFLERKLHQAPWINWSLFIGRLMFLGVALVPWLTDHLQAEIIIWILILRSIPMNFFSAGFSPMLANVIPARDRARILGNRSIINSAVVALSTFLFGKWLDAGTALSWATFPFNYQVMYLLGAVAAVLSAYFVSRIKIPSSKVIKRQQKTKVGKISKRTFKTFKSNLSVMFRDNQKFVRMVINTLVFNLGAWFVMSLYTIFFIKELHASDGWVGLNTTLANIGVILGNIIWRRIISKVGDNRALLLSLPMAASYALLVAIFPNLNLILIWGILINLINPGVNLSHYNILVELCPKDRLASYMAVFSTVMNIGAFVSPILGIALSEVMDIRWVLFIGGGIRLLGALMFYFWKVDNTKKPAIVPTKAG
jgi:MFS family permease